MIKVYTSINRIDEPKLDDMQYYIYIIENANGTIKIGRSHDVKQRINSLSHSNAGGTYITRVAVSPPTYLRTLEGVMHQYFDDYRVKGTEWFANVDFEQVVQKLEDQFTHPSYKTLNETRKQAGGYMTRSYGKKFKYANTGESDDD